jgi:diguanylate cyclase (GGDEF)-like protein
LIATGIVLVIYTILFLEKVPYSGNVINLPFIAVCGASAWLLWRHVHRPFTAVAHVSAIVLCAEMCVMTYRAILTNFYYMRPWETVQAQTDPRWMYSLAGMAFLATFMVMCYLWFLVAELGRELAEQASTDPLTGVMNRRAMEEAALREIARCTRYGYPLSLIMIDIDKFKHLNDTLGHAAGDCALQAFTSRVKKMLRCQDLLARMGGDEFVIMLPDTSASAGAVIAERIRQAIETLEVPFESGPIRFTVSAGIAQLDPAQDDWEDLSRNADAALYDAKQHGRNSVAAQSTEEMKRA